MSWDPVWDEIYRHQAWGKYPGEALIRFVARHFYQAVDRHAVKILEIGCGPGPNLWYCAREGFQVYGIDGSPHAVAQAKKRLDAECPQWRGDIEIGDIVNLPFEHNSFDAVIDNEAVYCNDFATSQLIYAEAARVLKPGGKLFARTFAKGCIGDGSGSAAGRDAWLADTGPFAGKGLARFTAKDDIAELLGAHFQVDSIDMLSWTIANGSQEIREWIINAHKTA